MTDASAPAGRKSWRDPATVIRERPWLHAIVLHRNINPKKPGSYIR